MFLLVPAYPGCPGSKAVKRSLLLYTGQTALAGTSSSTLEDFVDTKFYCLHAVAGGNQHIRLRDEAGVLNSVIYTVSVPACSGKSGEKKTKYTHTHPFNGPLTGTTRVSWYQKGKTNLDFTEARDNEWQWHQLGHMQVCTSLQTR